MHLTVVRHGESESNLAGIWQGHGNSPLSARGRQQAQSVAERLAGRRFDRVLSSDLSRAADTARTIAGRTHEDPQWREIDLGRWEGLTREQVAERFPDEVAALRRGEDVPVGGAESWVDVEQRVRAAFDRLAADARGERVLLVVHGGVVISLISSLFGVQQRARRPLGKLSNTAISELEVADEVWMQRYADAEHVGAAAVWRRELTAGRVAVDLVTGGPARSWQAIAAFVERHANDRPGTHHTLATDAASAHAAARAIVGHAGVARFADLRDDARAQLLAKPGEVTVGGWNLPPL